MRMLSGHRGHATYWAFVLHRVSGLVLALFLPVHLHVMWLAVKHGASFDGFIQWTEQPLVKLAEAGLIFLLAAHLTGGLRLLAVEFLPWREGQKTLAAVAGGLGVAAGLMFLVNAF